LKILLFDNGLPFDLNTPYNKSLGGSETSILLLAKGLAKLNHQVVLLSNINYKEKESNIILDNFNNFNSYAKLSNIIIFNRSIPKEVMNHLDKKLFYLSHDAYDQSNIKWLMNNNSENLLTKIICVSNWQKDTFIKYLNVDPNKLEVLGNPIDYSLYSGHTERNPNKLIFASIPFKGLDFLPDLFNEIKLKSKNEKLHLDIYSTFKLYDREEEDESYADTFRTLNNINNVNLFNPVSMKTLAYKFKQSGLYLAPSTYHETFGRVFIESMAGGCLPVAVNNGANKEIIEDYGYVLDYANIQNLKCFEEYVDLVCELLNDDLYNKRVIAERSMLKWDYIKLAKKLENIII